MVLGCSAIWFRECKKCHLIWMHFSISSLLPYSPGTLYPHTCRVPLLLNIDHFFYSQPNFLFTDCITYTQIFSNHSLANDYVCVSSLPYILCLLFLHLTLIVLMAAFWICPFWLLILCLTMEFCFGFCNRPLVHGFSHMSWVLLIIFTLMTEE